MAVAQNMPEDRHHRKDNLERSGMMYTGRIPCHARDLLAALGHIRHPGQGLPDTAGAEVRATVATARAVIEAEAEAEAETRVGPGAKTRNGRSTVRLPLTALGNGNEAGWVALHQWILGMLE